MRRIFFGLLLLLPCIAFAQGRRTTGDWTPYPQHTGCIGGSECTERRIRVALEDRPVLAIRFQAHDQIGAKADGALRVRIDGNTVRGYIDIPRRGETFTIDVEELVGRQLILETATDDEVHVSDIAVLYAPRRDPRDSGRIPRDRTPGRDAGGWRAYPRAGGCIGGSECGRNGDRITIALEPAPVLGVRFFAHDGIGQRADGKLRVRIDSTSISGTIDVKREGRRHEFDVDSVEGTRLVIETANNDEVEVKDIEILYGRRERRGPRASDELTHEGGCIGGDQCGGTRARIRIAVQGRPIESIRFYARDDIGRRAGGELRIRIDDTILQHALDIPREGKTFTIDGRGIEGDYLYFELAADDEVEIRDVRIRFDD